MKTPREILLQRHEPAREKLDAIRENVLATAFSQPARRPQESVLICAALTLWRELIWPCRRIWTGLAAVWLVIMVLNLATGEDPGPRMARNETAPNSPEMVAALREQRQLMAQLMESTTPAPSARPAESRPRGELRMKAFII